MGDAKPVTLAPEAPECYLVIVAWVMLAGGKLMDAFGQFTSGVDWDAVQSVGTLVTALIAWLVFLEARSIRRLQWVSQAADKWQSFNRMLVESGQSERWESIRSGAGQEQPLGATDKRLLLMYFNIQMIEYHLIRRRIVPSNALAAMKAELAGFRPHRAFVERVLAEGGYDPEYVRFVGSCMAD